MILSPERVSFDRITDTLYLGSRIGSLDDYHRLRAQGVKACVDMKHEGADPWTFEAFLWLPTVDHEPPSQAHLHMGIGFLRQCERAGLQVFVHCMAGVGRSATLVLAYLLAGSHRGQSSQDVLQHLRTRRGLVNPTGPQIAAAAQAAASYAG